MDKNLSYSGSFWTVITGLIIVSALYLTSVNNYLLFHSISEIFNIIIACGIFMVAWNSRRFINNNFLLFLGVSYLFVALLDLTHMLTYMETGLFHEETAKVQGQLWTSARYVESLSLLIAPLFLTKKISTRLLFAGYITVTALIFSSIFQWNISPISYITEAGLTPLSKNRAYIVSLILIASVFHLYRKKEDLDKSVFKLLTASIIISIFSELFIRLYVHEYSFTNLSGHFLKIISTFFIYKAIVEKGLMDPYNLLFRKLSESEELWRSITNSSPDHIMILDKELNIQFVNYASPGMAIEDLIGTPLYNYVPEEKQNEVRVILEGVLHTLKDARYETTYTSPEGSTINYESRATPRMISGSVVGLTVAARDITNRKKADEAIQHERDKLTNILDSMEDGIYIVNQDFDIEYINPVLKKDFGHVEGRKCYIYFHGLKEVCQWCKNKEVFKGKTVRWECFSDKTGKTYDLLDTPLKNPDGSLSKLELLRDITNHKKIEEELLSKQHLNQLLIDSLPYPAMLISKDRKVLAANLKAKEAGAKPGKYCWQSFGHTEFIPEKDKQFIAEHNKVPAHCIQCHFCMADESMQGRSHLNVDVLAWDRVWDTHWIPLDNTTYLHYAIDITERRQAEEELLRHREHLVDLVEERTHELKTSYQKLEKEFAVRKATEKKIGLMALFAELNPAPVMRINTIGEVIMANAAAIEILNINLQKTVTLSSILPGADRLDIQSCISNSTTLSLLTKIKDHYYHFIIRGISDLAMGQIYGTDITDQKKAEAETVQASQLALTGELAAGVAHEVNNPINGIINYSQILANRSSTKSEEHRIALLIIKESNRIANIVKELLAFTRTNNEDKRPAHIHEIMNDSLGLIKTHLENKGTTLKVNIPSSLPRVLANPQHLEQVFLNIINNAGYALNQKHTFSNNDKVLEISAEEIVTDNDNYILITFHDKGIGISKELLNNITEPFFTTKPGGKGTGLGLSISKSIISDHGGSLSIESTEGEFTRVTIKLPAATQHNENKPGTNLHNFSKGPK